MSKSNLEKLTNLSKKFNVYELCKPILEMPKFQICSGSGNPAHHHYGDGGLVEHTLDVCQLCLMNNEYFKEYGKGIDEKILFVAAFFHDVGKIHDYKREICTECGNEPVWEYSSHKKLIHHISRSVMMFRDCVGDLTDRVTTQDRGYEHIHWITTNTVDEIIHAILAHHGAKEYGSPVLPRTGLAWLLHLCDAMSARMDDCSKGNHND